MEEEGVLTELIPSGISFELFRHFIFLTGSRAFKFNFKIYFVDANVILDGPATCVRVELTNVKMHLVCLGVRVKCLAMDSNAFVLLEPTALVVSTTCKCRMTSTES